MAISRAVLVGGRPVQPMAEGGGWETIRQSERQQLANLATFGAGSNMCRVRACVRPGGTGCSLGLDLMYMRLYVCVFATIQTNTGFRALPLLGIYQDQAVLSDLVGGRIGCCRCSRSKVVILSLQIEMIGVRLAYQLTCVLLSHGVTNDGACFVQAKSVLISRATIDDDDDDDKRHLTSTEP
jgi:hypothetical protein